MITVKIYNMLIILGFMAIINLFARIESSKEVLKSFSYTFGLKMFECGEKVDYTREMAIDILQFWDINHKLVVEETGCLVICALTKLELIDSGGHLNRVNTEEYLKSNGAEYELANYIVDLYHRCHKQNKRKKNPCSAALGIAKCFRLDIHHRGWTPNVTSLQTIPYS